ncbi:DUF1642 domain-containing protein [Streptococcus parauberis]|uniref:DUF1642 domain-containing protein n=1 Tax=Streptococcus parauberis TaxID=1348 RepID=UPI00020CBD01|nr:DUF1642 domain-containing protein [Streptococcus parauberis]AEF26053.1 hypothetical protein STP_1605 [Streptococcus parauberis KCTC 11537]QBX27433.1 hypothetical protein Javan386_0034 [Streptococcus phage Javan386]UWM90928.1 DUF1642 domain-containing protein [Streptococcus parauberis]
MKIEEALYLPVKREGFIYSTDNGECKSHYRTLDGEEVSSSFKAKTKEELLYQPKKEVPQMIFDVIESFDDDVDYLHQHMRRQSNEVREWLTHNERDFYEAWLAYPNITVEKEKLYTVEIPNPNTPAITVLARSIVGDVVMCNEFDTCWKNNSRYQLTEQEIRKDFDWAWQQKFQKEVANEL